jgi:Na+/melibiose symporter-like transporter
MENNYITYILIGLALIAFFLAIKPMPQIKPYRNVFWILANVFFIAELYLSYRSGHDVGFSVIMLLVSNFGISRLVSKGE